MPELTERHSWVLLDLAVGKYHKTKSNAGTLGYLIAIGLVNARTFALTDLGEMKAAEYN